MSNTKLLYSENFQNTGCSSPGCNCASNSLYLHSRCHMKGPKKVTIEKNEAEVYCEICNSPVVSIAVSSTENKTFAQVSVECTWDKKGTRLNIRDYKDEEKIIDVIKVANIGQN